mmetsp:Transcript_449/g.801  ORF Transcript_449/g.801 Transcript_449/m.801 type:complete len:289 (-) Transcript_449:393-1259(-)
MMRRKDFEEVASALEVYGREYPDLDAIMRRHKNVRYDTLLSIYSQECTRRVQTSIGRIRAEDSLASLERRFLAGESFAHMCHETKTPPCVLMRLMLARMLGLGKQVVSKCLKDPIHILQLNCKTLPVHQADHLKLRLAMDVEMCTASDHVFAPYVDGLRSAVGLEFESVLEERLRAAGVSYRGEEALRAEGLAKTPDAKLDVPVAVRGRIVHWIDSKASFCDDWTFKTKGVDQFQGYVNRYGPGMVIYWFGFIQELNNHPDVLLVDDFPPMEDIVQLSTERVSRAVSP